MHKAHHVIQSLLSVCLTAIAPLVPLRRGFFLQTIQPFVTSCGTDDEISSKDRLTINQNAIEFVQNALGPNPETAYSVFTAEAKRNLSSDKFVAMFKQGIQQMGPFRNVQVVHAYLAKVTGGSQEQRVICGNLSSPKNWVAVNVKPGPAQAHIIVEAQTLNNTWAFVLWMLPEQGIWHIQYIQVMASAMVGRTAEDLQGMAESEKQRNHDFNTYILYATALQLAARGPFFQLGIQQEIQHNSENLKVPHVLEGHPPFVWQLGQFSFKVLNVGAIGVGQKLYLQVDHEIETWADDKDADKINHELISAFARVYPEYRDVFAGLVVRAHERGGSRGFGTVLTNDETAK
jgi:hypothetical protein